MTRSLITNTLKAQQLGAAPHLAQSGREMGLLPPPAVRSLRVARSRAVFGFAAIRRDLARSCRACHMK